MLGSAPQGARPPRCSPNKAAAAIARLWDNLEGISFVLNRTKMEKFKCRLKINIPVSLPLLRQPAGMPPDCPQAERLIFFFFNFFDF